MIDYEGKFKWTYYSPPTPPTQAPSPISLALIPVVTPPTIGNTQITIWISFLMIIYQLTLLATKSGYLMAIKIIV